MTLVLQSINHSDISLACKLYVSGKTMGHASLYMIRTSPADDDNTTMTQKNLGHLLGEEITIIWFRF